MCRSWTVGNDAPLWVNAVAIEQSEQSHHSNWTYVPEDMFDGPDGIWPCKDRGYDQLSAALAGGVLYAQSTQAVRETQKFPDGAALRIPARARLISDIHTLNASSESVTGHLTLTLYAIPEATVAVKLAPFHVDYHGLAIPPKATSRFSGACDIKSSFEAGGHPFELEVYYLLPHTHVLGSRMFVEVHGGPDDGKTLIDVRGNIGEPRGRAFEPPLPVTGATGLRFGCEFENPTDETIGWGFDDKEMCEALGFAKTPMIFETSIGTAEPDGTDGATKLFTGGCDTLAVEWNN
ncbi:MAG: hypothetical protein EXR75_15410 [Myxococcales bacterium]|nr:hypothetical protein [Myxococcales bacterium]